LKTAVVILNYNGELWLNKFLPNVIKHSKEADIYIIDNGSTDESLNFLDENFDTINIIKLKENLGYAGGYNTGLKELNHKYFVLLNSDIEVTENWLSHCISIMEKDETISAVQPKILSFNNRNKFEYAGAAGGFIDYMGYPFCRGRIFNEVENDKGQYNNNIEIFWASGACMFINASHFKDIGGFDASFFAHMEEIDLCWRLKNTGKKIFYCSESTVYHVGGGTLNYSNPNKTYLNFRNNLYLIHKNKSGNLLFFMLFRIILDGIAAFKFLFSGQLAHLFSVFKAHLSYYSNINKLNTFRRNNYRKNTKDLTVLYPRLIIWDYFVKNKKKYSDLYKWIYKKKKKKFYKKNRRKNL